MKRLAVTVAVMALLVSTQAIAEARGGSGGHGGGFGGGAGMMSSGFAAGELTRTRQQDRLQLRQQNPAFEGEHLGAGSGDQLGTRQQDRLRDPSLHTDPAALPEAPDAGASE